MPMYQYLCGDCRLRFESMGGAADAAKPAPCPRCSVAAPRVLPAGVRMSYQAKVTGIQPQNTGLSGMDANYDRVIGSSARSGWDAQRRRVGDKRAILRANPDARGEDIKRLPDKNVYEVMGDKERRRHDAAQPVAAAGRAVVRGEALPS